MADPYAIPALYDLEYAHQTDDVQFYSAVGGRSKGPVLELGCGNGRLTLPIARQGVEIHGVDASDAMLADLARKLSFEPPAVRARVHARLGDFRTVAVQPIYELVLWPFNALHHCPSPDAVRATLDTARRAVRPGGAVYVDCYLPDRTLYQRDPDRRYEERTFVDPRDGGTLASWEQGYWDESRRIHHVVYVYQRADGSEDRVHLELHMYEREELAGFVRDAGLRLLWQASDFAGSPMQPRSLKWVMQLAPR